MKRTARPKAAGSGKNADAIRTLESAVRGGDRTVETRCALAEAYAWDGRMDKALAALREAARLTHDPPRICTALQRLLDVARDKGETRACMDLAGTLAHHPAGRAMILGNLYLNRRMLPEAEVHLREALRLDPGKAHGHLMLGRLLEEQGETAGAEKSLARAVALAPDLVEARLVLAEALLRRKRLGEAEAQVRQALRREPGSSQAHVLLGKIHEEGGRPAEAEREYAEASGSSGSDDACLRLGEALLGRGQAAEAEAHLRKAVALGESSPRVFLLLVEVLTGQQRLEDAADALEEGIRRQPKWPSLRFKLGWICQQAGLRDRMTRAFEGFLKSGGSGREDERHHRFLALVALERFPEAFEAAERLLDEWDERLEYERLFRPWASHWLKPQPESFFARTLAGLEDAERRSPASPWPRLYRGLLLCRLRRTREGLAVLDELARAPAGRYGWMRFAAGVERLQLGRYAEALEDLRAAVASRPRAWWARCRLAETTLCLGKTKDALREFDRAEAGLSEERQRAEVWAWKGETLLWLGRYPEALEVLGRAVAAKSWLAVCWRGEAFMLSGRLVEALADLDRALAPGSRDTEAFILRGEARRRLGRLREALEDLDRAVELEGGTWALVNRALAHAGLGDWPAAWRDFEKVPAEVVDAALRSLGRSSWRGWAREDVVGILERALVLARGIRRPETYLYPVWLEQQGKKDTKIRQKRKKGK